MKHITIFAAILLINTMTFAAKPRQCKSICRQIAFNHHLWDEPFAPLVDRYQQRC